MRAHLYSGVVRLKLPIRGWMPYASGLIGLAVLTCLLLVIPAFLTTNDRHQTDEFLITNYLQHKEDFDRLYRIVTADGRFARSGPDNVFDARNHSPFAPARPNLSTRKMEEYRRLLSETGVRYGLEGDVWPTGDEGKLPIHFIVTRRGFWLFASSKGYAYMTYRPGYIVADLDKYARSPHDGLTFYRHVEGNWYLFHDNQGL